MKNFPEEEKNQRVVTFLNRDEVDFLDKLGKDALFSTGLKLSRAKLIAWLVDFIKGLNVHVEGIKSEKEFEKRIKEVFGQKLKGSVPPATPACPLDRQGG
jgi:hypothetical protein